MTEGRISVAALVRKAFNEVETKAIVDCTICTNRQKRRMCKSCTHQIPGGTIYGTDYYKPQRNASVRF